MADPARVALIGQGGVGRLHLAAYRSLPQVRVVALVDMQAPDLDDLAVSVGARAYRDAAAMLAAERPEIACVLTPAATHAGLTILCAANGAHVLCEKPMALTLAECERMIAACDAAGVRLGYGASYRFLPAMIAARALIRQGAIGEVMLMREAIIGGAGLAGRHDMGPAHYPPGSPGGSGWGMVDHGVHLIDAAMWLTGSPITDVYGRGNISGGAPGVEYLVAHLADGSVAQLTYEDGTFATELPGEGVFSQGGGWDISGPVRPGDWTAQPQTIHVHGSSGALRILQYANLLYLRDGDGLRNVPLPPPLANGQFAAQLAAFVRDIASGGAEVPDGRDGTRALRVLDGLYRSMTQGARQDLDLGAAA
jgi:predicted dehydrogenase